MERTEVTYFRREVAARLSGLSRERLRRLERSGLIRPARQQGPVRLYGAPELARLRKIRRLMDDLGVNLAGVEVILRLAEEVDRLRNELSGRDT